MEAPHGSDLRSTPEASDVEGIAWFAHEGIIKVEHVRVTAALLTAASRSWRLVPLNRRRRGSQEAGRTETDDDDLSAVMTLDDFESRLLNTENPLTAALDSLYGEGAWGERDADGLAQAILAAIEQAREDGAHGGHHGCRLESKRQQDPAHGRRIR